MRIELVIFFITTALIFNIYTDGKYLQLMQSNRKYLQMGGIALGGLMVYVLLKKFPDRAQNILRSSNEYMKYLPVDGQTASMLSPILDFTSNQGMFNNQIAGHPVLQTDRQASFGGGGGHVSGGRSGGGASLSGSNLGRSGGASLRSGGAQSGAEARILNSGKNSSKRSVSETKKKYVASRQGWKCGDCGNQLSAWFEVDHKIRLEHGGSNHVDNLVALCRECHGCKTAMENL